MVPIKNIFCSFIVFLSPVSAYCQTATIDATDFSIIILNEQSRPTEGVTIELLNNNKEVAQKFIRLLANNVSEKENQLLGLAYNSLRKKVAEALVLLQRKYQQTNGDVFSIDISRESLASIAGTATESVIRTLSDFRTEKLIDIKDGSITFINQRKLEHMIN